MKTNNRGLWYTPFIFGMKPDTIAGLTCAALTITLFCKFPFQIGTFLAICYLCTRLR